MESSGRYQQHTMGYEVMTVSNDEYKVNHNNCPSSMSPTTIISSNSDVNLASNTTAPQGAASAMLEIEINNHLQERRQRRLERNRESARQSRQKRKQFLEELEDNVCTLSEAMDKGRKKHVADAVVSILKLREERLKAFDEELLLYQNKELPNNFGHDHVTALFTSLSRSSEELRIASMFRKEQLKSIVIPVHLKCILWLTLQNDHYFRGGRAASERLSAARIGEKMLNAGNDCVPPTSGMWPLLCHEISLSYDQEERMRSFQRTLITAQSSWIERHSVLASSKLIESLGDSMNRAPEMLHRRETQVYGSLSTIQKLKFLSWANKNKKKVSMIAAKFRNHNPQEDDLSKSTSAEFHNAANLYILDRIVQNRVLQKLPMNVPTLPSKLLKKLGCRPSFESLGNVGKENHNISSDSSITSYPSSGSLKRPCSSISTDTMDISPHCININNAPHGTISPEVAQANAAQYVAHLLKPAGIVPYSARAPPAAVQPISLPPHPTPNTGSYYQPERMSSKAARVNNYPPPQHQYQYDNMMPYPVHCSPPVQSNYQQYPSSHHHKYPQSAIPPVEQREDFPMKPVPEEPIPVTNNPAGAPHHGHSVSAAEFLLDLADDWAIEGCDIEMPSNYY